MTARQNLTMFGRLFRLDKRSAECRADELLVAFGLEEVGRKSPKEFSGGMRRRLDLAASMILAPEVLFLDEPTTGLDPAGRREVWEAVRSLSRRVTTVLLTTHHLDEADQLCDRISVIDKGRNLVEDTPAGLKSLIGDERLEVVVGDSGDLGQVGELITRIVGTQPDIDDTAGRVSVPVSDGVAALTTLAAEVRERGTGIVDIGLRRPTLDEAFLQLTAHDTAESRREEP